MSDLYGYWALMVMCGWILDYWFDKFIHVFCMFIIWKLYKLVETTINKKWDNNLKSNLHNLLVDWT